MATDSNNKDRFSARGSRRELEKRDRYRKLLIAVNIILVLILFPAGVWGKQALAAGACPVVVEICPASVKTCPAVAGAVPVGTCPDVAGAVPVGTCPAAADPRSGEEASPLS